MTKRVTLFFATQPVTVPTAWSQDGVDVSLSQEDVAMFSSTLLSPLGLDQYVAERSRGDRGRPDVGNVFPFIVDQHPASQAHVAKQMVERLTEDAR